ncbi:tRNA (adenosine(37)-N6)-threonylcarbamoyltransferase complex ATPase subunit type 1 TsaE [Jannaschia sp. M317]|uniref:tRNA (adenosine(37)-N6)-threonylcarbamoyltransferase complex ATPase subunit type 1 TsaE n=1 Tax=Jannaschia sp. M317 TaxID=2867011 RepID=UPI0021A5CFE9|nr:tRNA (adenosine(37)-N6)-threonylcarbamoyltransferase complex ATPase subunit type 1 TsaE [Jannaschia sp. M317]UWQ18519.1 tRNA (adenosine(37)-N6)-threonylcarbamoyltransferase complex ATPase subunit type 1 TsaE [Jannaschia sp. M317]
MTAPDLILSGQAATDALAQAIAPLVGPGDTLLLEGEVGAGKTSFARALIQAIRARDALPPEDVPSPTFTLVQTYETARFDIWHADLYRLADPQEVLELGLADAFSEALCLIEWPDRLGPDTPAGAATLCFAHDGPEARRLTITGGALADRLLHAVHVHNEARP